MPNIAYFEIPADNVDRAKHFYKNVLGWKIEPIRTPTLDLKSTEAMEYQEMTLQRTNAWNHQHGRTLPAQGKRDHTELRYGG
jgi:predicted enzyme related to lactoylglutathione lyase